MGYTLIPSLSDNIASQPTEPNSDAPYVREPGPETLDEAHFANVREPEPEPWDEDIHGY